MAVLTKGELAIEKAIFFALVRDFAFLTVIVKNFLHLHHQQQFVLQDLGIHF